MTTIDCVIVAIMAVYIFGYMLYMIYAADLKAGPADVLDINGAELHIGDRVLRINSEFTIIDIVGQYIVVEADGDHFIGISTEYIKIP